MPPEGLIFCLHILTVLDESLLHSDYSFFCREIDQHCWDKKRLVCILEAFKQTLMFVLYSPLRALSTWFTTYGLVTRLCNYFIVCSINIDIGKRSMPVGNCSKGREENSLHLLNFPTNNQWLPFITFLSSSISSFESPCCFYAVMMNEWIKKALLVWFH